MRQSHYLGPVPPPTAALPRTFLTLFGHETPRTLRCLFERDTRVWSHFNLEAPGLGKIEPV
jgi:hypothetical protein